MSDQELAKAQCKRGDVLMTCSGAGLGKVWLCDGRDVAAANFVRILRPRDGRITGDFLFHALQGDLAQRVLREHTATSAFPNLRPTFFSTAWLPLPPVEVQRSIAEVLWEHDRLVSALDHLIAKKHAIKQGAIEALLSGRTRLSGFTEPWTARRLAKIGNTYGGLTGKTAAHFGHGSARYITFLGVISNALIDSGSFAPVEVLVNEQQNRVRKGDLFFNGSSETPEELGMCSLLEHDVSDVYLNSFCFGFRVEVQDVDCFYLVNFFRSNQGRKLLLPLAQGYTRHNLSKAALLKLEVPLPTLSEQRAIGDVLRDMDLEISAFQSQRGKADDIRRGAAQALLSGRGRLAVPKQWGVAS